MTKLNVTVTSVLILAVISITGCSTTPPMPKDGNISKVNIENITSKLANDSVLFLASQFAPAKTRFNINQQVRNGDTFSNNIVEGLRKTGFEILINAHNTSYNNTKIILDSNEFFVRSTIQIDNNRYSRCYNFNGTPISNWSVLNSSTIDNISISN